MKKRNITVIVTVMLSIAVSMVSVACQPKSVCATQIEKKYDDNSDGVVLISANSALFIRKAYMQWKKDNPERAKNMLGAALDGHGGDYLVIFYKPVEKK